jgi:signal transduction histidine kinase
MTEDTMKLIFTAFHQADSSLTRSYEGLGLGLSIVEKIVKLISGQIEVKSHFGVGSTFTVLLPYKKVIQSS